MKRIALAGLLFCLAALPQGCAVITELEDENTALKAEADSLRVAGSQCNAQLGTLAAQVQALEEDKARLEAESIRLRARMVETGTLPPAELQPGEQAVPAVLPTPVAPAAVPAEEKPEAQRVTPKDVPPVMERTQKPASATTKQDYRTARPQPEKDWRKSSGERTVTPGTNAPQTGAEQVPPPPSDDRAAKHGDAMPEQRPPATAPTVEKAGVSGEETFLSRYQAALSDFNRKRYTAAESAFTALLSADVPADMIDNCHYWIGECLYAQRKYGPAADSFGDVLAIRGSDKTEAALLMQANAYLELGDRAKARRNFKRIVAEYPNGEHVRRAQQKLRQMR